MAGVLVVVVVQRKELSDGGFEVVETFFVGDVVDGEAEVCVSGVGISDGSEPFLACGVPYLYFYYLLVNF